MGQRKTSKINRKRALKENNEYNKNHIKHLNKENFIEIQDVVQDYDDQVQEGSKKRGRKPKPFSILGVEQKANRVRRALASEDLSLDDVAPHIPEIFGKRRLDLLSSSESKIQREPDHLLYIRDKLKLGNEAMEEFRRELQIHEILPDKNKTKRPKPISTKS